eukprot:TRINITY_DN3737_c0_g1_i2.p1 TRINITY_DN3737_c0_g1~~TRINITY_DN3737_c0_g1_i2.p1  ORF type:complete len:244 (+),score=60.89 TRINITY_DN3737_c0_g1_i2:180-911(+)
MQALLITVIAFASGATAYSYAGRISQNSFSVGPPEQIALRLGPTDQSCILSWVNQLNSSTPLYLPADPVVGGNASAYYSEALVTHLGVTTSYVGYSTIWTENRCGTSRLLSNLLVRQCTAGAAVQYQVRNLQNTQVAAEYEAVTSWSEGQTGHLPVQQQGQPMCVALFGDMSTYQSVPTSIPTLTAAAQRSEISAVIHSGDIAYDIDDDCGSCLLYTSDAADEEDSVDLGGRRIIKKKKTREA